MLRRRADHENYILLARNRALRDHNLAQERVLCDLYYARTRREFETAHSPDPGQFASPPLSCAPQQPQTPSPRSYAIEEPADDVPATFSPVASPAGCEAEPEGVNDEPFAAPDVFLDISLVQHASLGAILSPHLRMEATQILLAILSKATFDPRKSLREVLDEFVHGCRNIECVRTLQLFVDGVTDYKKSQYCQGVVVAEASRQTLDNVGARTVAELRSGPSGAELDHQQPVRSTSGPFHPPETTNLSGGEQCSVPLRNCSPSAALPAGDRRTAAAPTSTYRHNGREAGLIYTDLNVAKLELSELPDPSEPIATGAAVDVTQSFSGAVKQILASCEGARHTDCLDTPDWVRGQETRLHHLICSLPTNDNHESPNTAWAQGILKDTIKFVREGMS